MLSYTYSKKEIESLHRSVVSYQQANSAKTKGWFARRVKNDSETLNDFIDLVPASLRLEAKRAVRRANEALKG